MKTAIIGDVGRYASHDGPGIRSVVFFKGCQLRCPWCHNPEYISVKPEIAFYADQCIACCDCVAICSEHAVNINKPYRVNRDLCNGCGLCAETCPTGALKLVGREYHVDELVELLLRDRLFYETSGGGVTLSGGEATLQMEFCGQILRRLKEERIHTAIETNGYFDWEDFKSCCLDWIDLILFDVKLADPVAHKRITQHTNEKIIENLAKLTQQRPKDVIVRVPIIPGYNDNKQNISAIAVLFNKLGVRRYSLLAYHPFGKSKAENIGRAVHNFLPEKSVEKYELDKLHRYFVDIEQVSF